MQTAAYVGLKTQGVIGAMVSFSGFGLPAFILMTSLAALYNNTHNLPEVLSAFSGLQAIIVAIIANAKKLTQFMDRDTNPNFAGANGMQGFLIDFLANPNQDLTAYLAKIQKFWDSLGS